MDGIQRLQLALEADPSAAVDVEVFMADCAGERDAHNVPRYLNDEVRVRTLTTHTLTYSLTHTHVRVRTHNSHPIHTYHNACIMHTHGGIRYFYPASTSISLYTQPEDMNHRFIFAVVAVIQQSAVE